MTSYTYLLVNFLTVIVCFVCSFDRRIRFDRQFPAFIKAVSIGAVPFIAWDAWFTAKGIWWFNTDYTLGPEIAGMPFEEWLFFICIPFSCIFTWYCLNKFFDLNWADRYSPAIGWLTIIVCTGIAVVYFDRIYTSVTAVFTLLVMLFLIFIARARWIGRASLVYLILMLGFFPVNGVLTGTGLASPVVNYNTAHILNIRMLTIPVEDAVYGYAQFVLNLYLFDRFSSGTVSSSHRIV